MENESRCGTIKIYGFRWQSHKNKRKIDRRRKQENGIFTFLYHPKLFESTGGFASARHFNVTFSFSGRIIKRLGIGSSLAKCIDTLGASKSKENENSGKHSVRHSWTISRRKCGFKVIIWRNMLKISALMSILTLSYDYCTLICVLFVYNHKIV